MKKAIFILIIFLTFKISYSQINYDIIKVHGEIEIIAESNDDEYIIYLEVPISITNQFPFYIELESEHLIDYRFLETSLHNKILVVRMQKGIDTLYFDAYTFIKHSSRSAASACCRAFVES